MSNGKVFMAWMQVPYLAWSEAGLLAFPIWLFWQIPLTLNEVFGRKAGIDAARPPKVCVITRV